MVTVKYGRALVQLALVFALGLMTVHPVLAQQITISGRLYHSVTAKPIAGATIMIEGTKLEAKSEADGRYTIPDVPPGRYHVLVAAPGFVAARREITVATEPITIDVAVDPELHYSEVVSVSPDARDQFESYQPTTVLPVRSTALRSTSVSIAGDPGA